MEEDLLLSLTRQVKEEVIENYLTERRLIELQIEEIQSLAQQVLSSAHETGKRFNRLGFLTMEPEFIEKLAAFIQVPPSSMWKEYLSKRYRARGVRFIRVGALTSRAKFRKLFIEAYRRLCLWMNKYEKECRHFNDECEAVNRNIKSFHNKFDLLAILNFLKSLDVIGLERKHFLGENFTPEELCSIDQKLCIFLIKSEQFDVPPAITLPKPDLIEDRLGEFANEVYRKHQSQAKSILR